MRRFVIYLVFAAGAAAILAYFLLFRSNVSIKETPYVYIRDGATLEQLIDSLNMHHQLSAETDFRRWAAWLDFKTPRGGRFKLTEGMSSRSLVKHLQRGEQSAVKVVLNNELRPINVAAKAARFIMADSSSIAELLQDSTFLDSLGGYSENTIMSVFIPNTYQLYWNTDARGFLERMKKEHDRFWTDERKALASAQQLDPAQAYTMASLVDGETNIASEMPDVAGLYLNRLHLPMPLQADPTVQFALIQAQGGTWRRLTNADYRFRHPYNTYLFEGLPPGPVGMPGVAAIEAVLKPTQHDYIYMVAKPDNTGAHAFSRTYEEHLVKVKQFTDWLNSR